MYYLTVIMIYLYADKLIIVYRSLGQYVSLSLEGGAEFARDLHRPSTLRNIARQVHCKFWTKAGFSKLVRSIKLSNLLNY